jgi:hypothetical protein
MHASGCRVQQLYARQGEAQHLCPSPLTAAILLDHAWFALLLDGIWDIKQAFSFWWC